MQYVVLAVAVDAFSTTGVWAGSKQSALLCMQPDGMLSGISSNVLMQEEVGSISVLPICQC